MGRDLSVLAFRPSSSVVAVVTKIAIVGEAWGADEERERAPFVGYSGKLLTQMLAQAGINRAECFLTNVFNLRPQPKNDIENLCQKEKSGGFPPLARGKYLRPEFFPEVHRVVREIRDLRPNLVVLCGNTPSWAFLGVTGISKIRGTVTASTVLPQQKCLPVYHPAAVIREMELRPITVLDFEKAKREAEFPDIRRPKRTIYIPETMIDLEWYYDKHLATAKQIMLDIETRGDEITCIGFAPDASSAICVPFVDPRRAGGSYWLSEQDERAAWAYVRKVLNSPQPKIGQNGLYDLTFLWASYGITVRNYEEDTMLLHHALHPESDKGLGFLGSVYTNEASWKLMRKKSTTIKKDE